VNNFKTDVETGKFEICFTTFNKTHVGVVAVFSKRFTIYSKTDRTAFVFIVG